MLTLQQMDKKPFISVLMGIYNCEETLSEAIESIIHQTYENWELIMCDDASSDRTYSIALKYKSKYNNISVIKNKKNMGLNATLNRCLKRAKGEYIARMDGDDISLPERFEKEILFLVTHKQYAIVSCPMQYFDEKGVFRIGKVIEKPQKRDFAYGTPFAHAPCMVRKEAYLNVGGYSVAKRLLRVEDYHLWFKMYEKGYIGYNLPEALYMMRDDREAFQRRRYKYRINEAYVLGLAIIKFKLNPVCLILVLKPLIVGLLPTRLYRILHKNKGKKEWKS